MTTGRVLIASLTLAAFVAGLAGCATDPSPPPSSPPAANLELPFDPAVAQASDALMTQARRLPAFRPASSLAGREGGGTVLDPMLDATTGQQTAATVLLERRVVERLRLRQDVPEPLLPFTPAKLPSARYLLTGTLTRSLADRAQGSVLINLALTDLRSGQVVAQSWALARDDGGLDHSPLPFYADSPVLVRDAAIEGYVKTSATAAGKPANRFYLDRLAAAAVIAEANLLYNSGENASAALARYRDAARETGGDQLRVLNGLYLTSTRLGKGVEAEQSFSRLVAYGLAHDQLGVKFLFNPGSTVFWSDPKVSSPYPMWLRQIAREITAAKSCMTIVGHTSRTGLPAANDQLSLQRAAFIRQRLLGEASVLGPRLRPKGMGSSANIVGSGTDNAVDALDRRVEFRIVPCG